jgi:hypothetical protein
MPMRKLLYTAFAAAMMTVGLTFGVQAVAAAAPVDHGVAAVAQSDHAVASDDVSVQGWPTGCTYGKIPNEAGAYASCSNSNGGSYKATVNCARIDGGGIVVRDAGVWKTSGTSYVFCPPLTVYKTAGIITKSWY